MAERLGGEPGGRGTDWWRQAVVYQIYPRSFADSDGDGIGDLRGIISRVPYLAALGIDAVWLSPFYPSALADGGYDVDDHRDVDPRLGSLEVFDELVATLHREGLRVVVDIVPNHTSDRHRWFVEALASPPGSPARDRYVFHDGPEGRGGVSPPSDWTSFFGGPAWEQVPDGQWYLHLFAREQPDLNWDSREVREDFLATLRFWADRGVDGFRVDVAHYLVKDLSEPLASQEMLASGVFAPGSHPYCDRDEVHDIYREWRRVFDEYDPPRSGVAEAWVAAPRLPAYAHPEGLGQAFSFDLLEANWSADEFRQVIDDGLALAAVSGSSTTWVLSNHDVVRHPSRYGLPQGDPAHPQKGREWLRSDGSRPALDRALGSRRARAATMLMLALPGAAYLYQGEELGLHEVADLPRDVLQDPTFVRSGGADKGRDGCRVPIPWTRGGPSYGFGPGTAHLPQPAWFGDCSVEAQEGDGNSALTLYRRALALRRTLVRDESLRWKESDPAVVRFERGGGWQCLVNFGAADVPLPLGRTLLASSPLNGPAVPPDTAVWIATVR